MESFEPFLDEGFQIEKYWKIIKPRLHWPVLFALLLSLFVFAKNSMKTPMFRSVGMLLIEPEKNIINFNSGYGYADYRNEYLNTQIRILKSRSLAKSVFEEIGVYPVGVRIMPVESTRLVEVSCTNPIAENSAKIINTLFEKLIEFNLAAKTRSSREASEFIGKQIRALRASLAQKEQELQSYGKKKDLFYLSRSDSTVVAKFSDLNKAYTKAQINRVNKEAHYKELKGMNYEDYPDVKQDTLISDLKSNYSKLESEYQKKSEKFKKSYPQMRQLESQMKTLQERISTETRVRALKTLKNSRTNYLSAKKEEDSLKDLLDQQKGVMITSKTNAIYYNSLQIEVRTSRNLLDYLVKRQKESLLTSKMEGLQTTNIRIIDYAEVPHISISSNIIKSVIMALILGLGIGIGLIFFIDFLDKTLKSPEDVKTYLKLPTLGIIPSSSGKSGISYYSYHYGSKKKAETKGVIKNIELINFRDPESPFSEHYRSIRTSIQLSTPKEPPKIISVSSALPSEGKTVTVINLAISFSQLGKKVVVIDADLRKPRVHKIFKMKNTVGLSTLLTGRAKLTETLHKTHIKNVFVIPSGPIPPNPAELLDSDVMTLVLEKLLEKVDYIFLDTPPLIGIVDPILIGKHSDGMILVNWGGKTKTDVLRKAKDEIDRFGVRILGVVLNKIDFKKSDTSYSYTYNYNYGYNYRYKEKNQQK